MTVRSEVTGISTVNLVMECWFAQTVCPAAIETVGALETSQLPLMSLSYEEKPSLLVGQRTVSPGAAEAGSAGAGKER